MCIWGNTDVFVKGWSRFREGNESPQVSQECLMWEGGRRKAECFEGSGSQTRGSMVQIPSPPVTFYPRTSAGKIKHKCQSLLSCFQVPGKIWCFIYRQCFLRQISQLLEDKQRKERSVLSCLSCSFNWNQELLRESLCVQGKKYIKKQHPRGKTSHLYCIHKKKRFAQQYLSEIMHICITLVSF